MTVGQDILEYFSNRGFNRLLQELGRKYRSLGRIGGKVRLPNPTPEEQEALSGLLGRDLSVGNAIVIELAQIDKILQESRFAVSLDQLLAVYFRQKQRSNREIEQEKIDEWRSFFDEVRPNAIRSQTQDWLRRIQDGTGQGYRGFLALYQEDRNKATQTMVTCLKALDELPVFAGTHTRRPVFAAKLTGDPHGFDRDKPLGRLLYSGMLFVLGITGDEASKGSKNRAETVKEIFRKAGLEEDDLSSNVITAGLRTSASDAKWGLFESAWTTKSPVILPLRFFEMSTDWLLLEHVYVVENPAVLSAVLDAWNGPGCPPLICSSGQPSVAALRLLDELSAKGSKLYYSGDFDAKGLEMAIGLHKRYDNAFVPWLFDTSTYLSSVAGTELSNEQKKRIGLISVPWDQHLSDAIIKRGYIVYQETLVDRILSEIRIGVRRK